MFGFIIFVIVIWFINEVFSESNNKNNDKLYMEKMYWTVWNEHNIVPNSFTRWYYKKKYRAEVEKLIEENVRLRREENETSWKTHMHETTW